MKAVKMVKRPKDLVITVRKIDFHPLPFLKNNHEWHKDGAVIMHFMNAFQSLFPDGEGLFIDAVRDSMARYSSKISQDPVLQQDIDTFIKQEGHHSVLHEKWNQALIISGYQKMNMYNKQLYRFRLWARTHLNLMTRLSLSIASEQYTASLAGLFTIGFPEIILHSPPIIQKIFLYHALEELEHKSVCFDLYQKLNGGYLRRMAGMIFITFDILINTFLRQRYLLRADGKWNRQQKKECWELYLGQKGLVHMFIPKIGAYIRPSFYPWQSDERKKFEKKFGHLLKELRIPGFVYKVNTNHKKKKRTKMTVSI
jgi:predicted metal-dependent hydrolase